MVKNFPNLVKETDIRLMKNRESQIKLTQRGPHQGTSQLKCQKLNQQGFSFNFKVGNKQKQIHLTIYQMASNHIKEKWKRKNPSNF